MKEEMKKEMFLLRQENRIQTTEIEKLKFEIVSLRKQNQILQERSDPVHPKDSKFFYIFFKN